MHSVDYLAKRLLKLGASDAKTIPASLIVVEDRLAQMCASPQCPGYGLSPGCPPHVMKPEEFRNVLAQYEHAIVFKIDTPTEVLLGEGRRDVARLIHEFAASIELMANANGYSNAMGLAAGSCKMVFCHDHDQCAVLNQDGDCRFPNAARPSISGLGVNFLELCKAVGWQVNIITSETNPDDTPMGMLTGIVLLGQ